MSLASKVASGAKSVVDHITKSFRVIRHHIGVASPLPKYISESLQYRNIVVERGDAFRSVIRTLTGLFKPSSLGHRLAKLASSKIGREFLVNMYMKAVQNNLKNLNPEELEKLKNDLKKLADDPNLKGRKLANTMAKTVEEFVRNKISKEVSDPKQAKKMVSDILKKIHRDTSTWVLKGIVFNKNGDFLDLVEAKLYTKSGEIKNLNLDPSNKEAFKQSMEILKNHGFNTKGEKYARMIESKILVESVMNSNSVKDAYELYREGIEKRMEADEEFKKGFKELMKKELMRTYNASVIFTALNELFVKFPSHLAATLNKMLAQAVRRLPMLGDVAAVQYEAGAALAEIGDKLSDRIESLSQMSFNLDKNLSESSTIKDAVSKSIEEAEKKTQTGQTATVPVA